MIQAERPGRNDLCWCGSGRKYKNCHLRADEQAQASEHLSNSMVIALQEYALQTRWEKDFKSARDFFYGPNFKTDEDDEDERLFVFERALDYFIHDYRLGDDGRLIEHFAKERSKQLRPDERVLLQLWLHSRLAAFEVIEVQGDRVRLLDIVSGEDVQVQENHPEEHFARWDVLFTRLFSADGQHQLAGMGLYIPARFRNGLRSYAQELWDDYLWRHPNASYEEFTHASSQLLNQFILNEIEPAMNQLHAVVTSEGDLVEVCRAGFDVVDYPMALAALRGADEFQETAGQENGVIEFLWREAGDSLTLLREHGPEFSPRPAAGTERGAVRHLGHLGLSQRELEFETQSRRRLRAGRELLERRLQSAIQFVEEETISLEQALAMLPEAQAEEPEHELSEEMEAFEAEQMAQEKQAWVDRRIPALGGRAPREAVQTLAGRVGVIRLLKEFEGDETRRARSGKIPFSWDPVRNELGLAEQEFLDETMLEDRLAAELDEMLGLAAGGRPDDALARWRRLRSEYRIETAQDFEFADVWDLYALFEETLLELLNGLSLAGRYADALELARGTEQFDASQAYRWQTEEARLYIEQGDVERGERLLRELTERYPDDYEAAAYLAGLERDRLNRPEDALATLRRALAEVGDQEDRRDAASSILELLRDLGRYDEAAAFWHEWNDPLHEGEQGYLGWVELALARRDLKQAHEGIEKLRVAELRDDQRSRLAALEGKFDLARRGWGARLALPEEGDRELLWDDWAELHLRLHDADLLVRELAPLKERLPAHALYCLAFAATMQGDHRRAADLGREAAARLQAGTRAWDLPASRRELRRLAEEAGISPDGIQAVGL